MGNRSLLYLLFLLPFACGASCLLLRSSRVIRWWICAAVVAVAAASCWAAWLVSTRGPIFAGNGWLYLDALSAYHLVVLQIVFSLSSFYARPYFDEEIRERSFDPRLLPRYGALWLGALGAMNLVMVSNNLGIMWVGIEATTLLTAFLICLHPTKPSLEAMWKYLIMCSVGVALAFIGILFVGAAGSRLPIDGSESLLWTRLHEFGASLDPFLLKIGFVFLLVGYGTKAGLAPMHSWLPDAHSQAPAPVSAVFSGFLLNTALYCIMRYVPLVEAATGRSGWSLDLLVFFGIFSILIAGAFIIFQHDSKRLLAYCSVEHMGIIALGIGIGGLGTFAALFHVLNHSICKVQGFFAAGRLGQLYGTHDMTQMKGVFNRAPVWGAGFFVSVLALIGVAPFAIFMSKFQIVQAAVDGRYYVTLALFLLGSAIVFIGALRHVIGIGWGSPDEETGLQKTSPGEAILSFGPLAVLLSLGLWMPDFLRNALEQAAIIIRG